MLDDVRLAKAANFFPGRADSVDLLRSRRLLSQIARQLTS